MSAKNIENIQMVETVTVNINDQKITSIKYGENGGETVLYPKMEDNPFFRDYYYKPIPMYKNATDKVCTGYLIVYLAQSVIFGDDTINIIKKVLKYRNAMAKFHFGNCFIKDIDVIFFKKIKKPDMSQFLWIGYEKILLISFDHMPKYQPMKTILKQTNADNTLLKHLENQKHQYSFLFQIFSQLEYYYHVMGYTHGMFNLDYIMYKDHKEDKDHYIHTPFGKKSIVKIKDRYTYHILFLPFFKTCLFPNKTTKFPYILPDTHVSLDPNKKTEIRTRKIVRKEEYKKDDKKDDTSSLLIDITTSHNVDCFNFILSTLIMSVHAKKNIFTKEIRDIMTELLPTKLIESNSKKHSVNYGIYPKMDDGLIPPLKIDYKKDKNNKIDYSDIARWTIVNYNSFSLKTIYENVPFTFDSGIISRNILNVIESKYITETVTYPPINTDFFLRYILSDCIINRGGQLSILNNADLEECTYDAKKS